MNNKKHKTTKIQNSTWVKIVIFLLIVLGGMIFILISPLGNRLIRDITPFKDTPMDVVVKNTLERSLSEQNNEFSQNAIHLLNSSTTKEMTDAAKDENKTVALLQGKMGLDKETSTIIASEFFNNEELSQLREKIEKGDWLAIKTEVDSLKETGKLEELKEKFSFSSIEDVKKLQDEAMSILSQ